MKKPEPKSCRLKMRKRVLTSQVQVSLRGWGASCWSWYTLGENPPQKIVWVDVLIITSYFQISVCKSFAVTYSKTSTLVACIRHDLRTERAGKLIQTWAALLQCPQVDTFVNNHLLSSVMKWHRHKEKFLRSIKNVPVWTVLKENVVSEMCFPFNRDLTGYK